MTVEVALLISVISVVFSVYFGLKNSKHTDTKDIESRVAENTKLNIKIDETVRNTAEIKEEIRLQRQEVQSLTERMAKVEASASQAHKRIDRHEMEHGGVSHE